MSRNPQGCPSTAAFSFPPDFDLLVEKLEETAQTLLAFLPFIQQRPARTDLERTAARYCGETQCFYFSPFTLKNKRSLMDEKGIETLHARILDAYISLRAFILFLDSVDPHTRLDDSILHLLAKELRRTEKLLFLIQDVCSSEQPPREVV